MRRSAALDFVNHGALARLLHAVLADRAPVRKILLISPSRADRYFVGRLFPGALIIPSQIFTWNLNDPPPTRYPKVDLAIASHVQMYAADPERWIRNILSIADVYAFQDLKYRKRSRQGLGFGVDGDCIRYTLKPEATRQTSYVLERLPYRIEHFFEFEGVPNELHTKDDAPVHVCAALSNGSHPAPPVSFSDVFFTLQQQAVIFARTNLGRLSRRLFF
jgi:hypothetical protein